MTILNASEKRRDPRVNKCSVLFWRDRPGGQIQPGWLIERSEGGLAFAWKGDVAPSEGDVVEICFEDSATDDAYEDAVVRRVKRAHADLYVLGLERLGAKEFAKLAIAPSAPSVSTKAALPAGRDSMAEYPAPLSSAA